NSGWWDGLPEDVRAGLQKAMAGATAYANKLAAEINDRDQKLIAEAGKAKIQTLSKRDIAAWREAVRPVWSKFSDQIGEDLIAKARASNNS
ncbi:C4-dicarboxylate ABC transporter, partial [Castellaniella denitrificans]|nr:C4-dicarboxylate ABC transporter [Castellaniella denitrificans]